MAIRQSQSIRDRAEEDLARIAEEKAKEVLAAESRLKTEVEVLWIQFGESVEAAERNGVHASLSSRRRQSSAKKPGLTSLAPGVGASAASASVRIHDFVPATVPPPRASSRSSPGQVTSALSASLAESSFHYPQAAQAPAAASTSATNVNGVSHPHVDASRSLSPNGATNGVQSPAISSPRTVAMLTNASGEVGTVRDAYRRNMDQSVDTATSFRYFTLEAQMKEQRRDTTPPEQGREESLKPTDGVSESATSRGRSPKVSKSAIKKPKESAVSGSPSTKARSSSTGGESSPKSKRKVTFVVKPDVAIINTENADVQDQVDVPKDEGELS